MQPTRLPRARAHQVRMPGSLRRRVGCTAGIGLFGVVVCGSLAAAVGTPVVESVARERAGVATGDVVSARSPVANAPRPIRSERGASLVNRTGATPSGLAQTETQPTRTDSGYIVQASDVRSLRLVGGPEPAPVGEWIECGYFEIPVLGAAPGLLSVPLTPRPGLPYFLRCWHRPAGNAVAGYPVIALFDPSDPVPGLVDPVDVAAFAQSQLDLEPPAVELSPPSRQLVGVDTWLAVTSSLAYPDVTAQAGLAWATVRTTFRDAVWDMGDGARVVCVDDVATIWTAEAGSSTECSHTYTMVSPEGAYPASVSVTWELTWINNEAAEPFVPWTDLELTTSVPVAVDQLQAVIR